MNMPEQNALKDDEYITGRRHATEERAFDPYEYS